MLAIARVESLCVVDFQASRHPRDVDVADVVQVLTQSPPSRPRGSGHGTVPSESRVTRKLSRIRGDSLSCIVRHRSYRQPPVR